MKQYIDFSTSILPGNYALTKSMELTKIQSSGTLWYTKKFLVLYYYVFLSNEITSREYITKVISHFDLYINSLPESVQERARDFFYPSNSTINFKSPDFKSFSVFAGKNDFISNEERSEYYKNAKKCYFSLLMNSGGQTGIKKSMKEAMQDRDFVYSASAIQRILKNAAILSIIEDVNLDHNVHDHSTKYILSTEAINHIKRLSLSTCVTYKDALEISNKYPKSNPKYKSIENDTVAFIRNERQILYYYGYFHSKSSGANDIEFSSLTPVGEMALVANHLEFLALWEHQKIKMLSQPATADINDVAFCPNECNRFGISYTPYLDILKSIKRNLSLTLDQYKFVLSRKKVRWSDEDWNAIEPKAFENIDVIQSVIQSWDRSGDVRDEDFRKELLKYILGIRSDLSFDASSNILGCVKFSNGKVTISDKKKFDFLISVYDSLNAYKLIKYSSLFDRCESDLKIRYHSICRNASNNTLPVTNIDSKVKIDWDLYNIYVDKFIYLSVLLSISCIQLKFENIFDISKENLVRIVAYIKDNFSQTLKLLGLQNIGILRKTLEKTLFAIRSNDFSTFISQEHRDAEVLAQYTQDSLEDLFNKIQSISKDADVYRSEGRTRNANLVSLMKSYYMQMNAADEVLRCECCREETFITQSGEPYVEFHHLIPFNIAFGPDHFLNLFALCPNCHRKLHFLALDEKANQYSQLKQNNHLQISFIERLLSLRRENLLRSYHLEYLLSEHAITAEEYNYIAA